jgi:type IV secretion system protein VirB4
MNIAVRKAEKRTDDYIPYIRHVDAETIVLDNRSVMSVLTLEGVAFETNDQDDLNSLHRALNTLYRNIGDERIALWTHVVRREEVGYPQGKFRSDFAATLDEKYRVRMTRSA